MIITDEQIRNGLKLRRVLAEITYKTWAIGNDEVKRRLESDDSYSTWVWSRTSSNWQEIKSPNDLFSDLLDDEVRRQIELHAQAHALLSGFDPIPSNARIVAPESEVAK